ncbi:alkyl hydroperoxide reductase [Leptolyngbya sp. 'hensonii']|uniref:peroxiredoxin family protein n=1 Tax=Leptolyngbya sp. 'hensonii' TaxID=1922337 RepID=UPI00094FFE59|nr:redoxin domain-containing protein [Leptolyngbya sp. 'hensonii']OLP16429.1 alkyl hydroperoxide reductase [Leptolyngbya sp. 'hensonii']
MLTSNDFSGLFNQRFFNHLFPIPATNQLQLGEPTPDFTLTDVTQGGLVQLSQYRGNRPVLLAFTRIFTEKQYCPFCYPHIKALNENYDRILDLGAELLMITSTDERQSRIVARDLGLQMPLLTDSSCAVFQVYQTGQALGAPLPAQFVLDPQGRLRYRHLFSFLSYNAGIEELLQAIAAL